MRAMLRREPHHEPIFFAQGRVHSCRDAGRHRRAVDFAVGGIRAAPVGHQLVSHRQFAHDRAKRGAGVSR